MTELNHFTPFQSSRRPNTSSLPASPCAEATAARRRFLAEHGPGADFPRRPTGTKEARKALLAAEMARWECF